MSYTTYLAISSACLCFSYLLFILLRRDIWFLQQRIFLIASVILSVCIPLTHISVQFNKRVADVTSHYQFPLPGLSQENASVSEGLNHIRDIIFKVYIAIAFICIIAIIFQLLWILWLYITAEKSKIGNITFLKNRIKTPFSFFGWIFIPSSLTDAEEIKSICIHESIHSNQYHSLDNMILGIACAAMWFNPFVWIMKKSLHLVHEYLADEGTLSKGIEKTSYQALLVNQAAESQLISIPSGFNNNLLKKRMIMMTKTNTKDSSNARILSIIPLPLLLLLAVSIINGLLPAELKAQKKETGKDSLKEVVVTGYGTQKGVRNTEKDTINYIVDGVKADRIDDINPDSIESVNVLKEDRTVIIRTKGFSRSRIKTDKISFRSAAKPQRIVYILDGKKVSEADFDDISPEMIESINVIKDERGVRKYTKEDCDGVIVVKSKK